MILKIGPIVQINITRDSNNKHNSDNKVLSDSCSFDENKKILHINTEKLTSSQKKALKEVSIGYVDEGNKLLEYKTSALLDELYNYKKNKSHDAILTFFKPIIPYNDFEALDASLFLREKFQKGETISHLKSDIRNRFGDRGNHIANLCTAGYFDTFLVELFNELGDKFNEIYENIVNNAMMALFVNQKTKSQDITTEISNKMAISKKYGIKFFHIHGISKNNIAKIQKCLADQKNYFDFFEKNIYKTKDGNIIIVELIFK